MSEPQTEGQERGVARADAIALLLLAALAAGLMAPFVFQGRIPLNADFVDTKFEPWWRYYQGLSPQNDELDDPALYIYPDRELSASMLRRGILPLWNPFILCGTPFLADDVSLPFDPFGVLAMLFAFPVAWGLMILAQLVVAGWSMYALLRHFGCSRAAGFVSGATLMLCGTFTVWLEYVSWIGTFCWAPLCLLCLDVGIRRVRAMPFVGAAVLLAFTILGGLLQLSLYFFAMMAVYGLWQIAAAHLATRDWGRTVRRVLLLAMAFGFALLLASAQLLPTLEVAATTYRSPGRYVGANHLTLGELLPFVAPNLFGNPGRGDQFAWRLDFPNFLTRHGGYLGILPLVLAFWALTRVRRDARVACFAAIAFGTVGFLVALGFGLERLVLAVLPAFGGMHAKRMVVVWSVSGSVLAGFGLDALVAAGRGRVRLLARVVGVLAVIALIALVVLEAYARDRAAPGYLRAWRRLSPAGVLAFYYGVAVPLVLLGGTWALLRFGPRLGARRWALALAAFAAADLLWQARLYNPFVSRDMLYPPTSATDWVLEQPGVFRIGGISPPLEEPHPRLGWWARRFKGDMIPPNTGMPLRLWDVRGRSSLFPKWVRDYAEAITGNRDIRVLVDYREPEYRLPMVDLLGPRYVLSAAPLDLEGFRLARDGPVKVYEDGRAAPRAYVARDAEVVEDDAAALKRLAEGAARPPQSVILDRQPPPATGAESPASAEIEAYGPNEVLLRITRPGGGFLVLTDTWFPGWHAWVDGKPAAVLRANAVMRCVPLAGARSQVRLVYEPQSFRLGLFLSLVGVAIVFAFLGARWAAGPARRDSHEKPRDR